MNKKRFLIILLIVLSSLCLCPRVPNSKASLIIVKHIDTDKEFYYTDEMVSMNATYIMNIKEGDILNFFQFRIRYQDVVVWKSERFFEEGNLTDPVYKERNVSVKEFFNESGIYNVSLFYYSSSQFGSNEDYCSNKLIELREIGVEVSLDLTDGLEYGDPLILTPEFNKTYISKPSQPLYNETITLTLIVQNTTFLTENYITNETGSFFTRIENLPVAELEIIFNLSNPIFYKNNSFRYSINILRKRVFCEVSGLKDSYIIGEKIEIRAKILAINGNRTHFLENTSINIEIQPEKYELLTETNSSGFIEFSKIANSSGEKILNISISQNHSIYNQTDFIYNFNVKKRSLQYQIIQNNLNNSNQNRIFLELQYFYNINSSIEYFSNQSITVLIENEFSTVTLNLTTNNLGIMIIDIKTSELNMSSNKFSLSILFKGSELYEEHLISFYISKNYFSSQNRIIENMITIIIFCAGGIFIAVLIIRKKAEKQVKISEITLKY